MRTAVGVGALAPLVEDLLDLGGLVSVTRDTDTIFWRYNEAMPKTNCPAVISEDEHELEKRHRYSHLFHRAKLLRLLESGACSNLGETAEDHGATTNPKTS